jgi:hypothetical protein
LSQTDELEDKTLEVIGWKGPKIGDQGQRQDFFEGPRVTLANSASNSKAARAPAFTNYLGWYFLRLLTSTGLAHIQRSIRR